MFAVCFENVIVCATVCSLMHVNVRTWVFMRACVYVSQFDWVGANCLPVPAVREGMGPELVSQCREW